MLTENRKVEWEKRKLIAEKVAFQTDEASERMMSIAIAYLDNEFLSENFQRFKVFGENRSLRDSIIASNYMGFLNSYDTRFYIYDSTIRHCSMKIKPRMSR